MKLALIQDYHHNFLDLYEELEKKHEMTMIGDSYFQIPWNVNHVQWSTWIMHNLYFSNPFGLHKHLDGHKVALIKDFSQPKSLFSIIMCRMMRIKYAVVIQKMSWVNSGYTTLLMSALANLVIKRDTPIIATVQEGEMSARLFFNNVKYIPFAVKPKTNIIQKTDGRQLNVLCVGKLDQARKNHGILLRALNELKTKDKIKLTFVGSHKKKNKYYKQFIKFLMEKSNYPNVEVEIKENLTQEEIADEYRYADLFVCPSRHEPAMYSLLEAMSYGLPVICSNENGTSCYIEDNGAVFKAGDKADLIKTIERVAFKKGKIDWGKLERQGKSSYNLVDKNHLPEKIAEDYDLILEGLNDLA